MESIQSVCSLVYASIHNIKESIYFKPNITYSPHHQYTCFGIPIQNKEQFDNIHLIWLTYRSGFQNIGTQNIPITTDNHWGCCIRSGQMAMAHALVIDNHILPSAISQLFSDDPRSPFGIHAIVEKGNSLLHKTPGEWFGPSTIAVILKSISESIHDYMIPKNVIYSDMFVYSKTFLESNANMIWFSIRLGSKNISPLYFSCIKRYMHHPLFRGMIGGQAKKAFFFFGTQRIRNANVLVENENGSANHDHYRLVTESTNEFELLYLDPHTVQPALEYNQNVAQTPKHVYSLPIHLLEPSFTILFFCQSKTDIQTLHDFLYEVQTIEKEHAIIKISDQEYTERMDALESFD